MPAHLAHNPHYPHFQWQVVLLNIALLRHSHGVVFLLDPDEFAVVGPAAPALLDAVSSEEGPAALRLPRANVLCANCPRGAEGEHVDDPTKRWCYADNKKANDKMAYNAASVFGAGYVHWASTGARVIESGDDGITLLHFQNLYKDRCPGSECMVPSNESATFQFFGS